MKRRPLFKWRRLSSFYGLPIVYDKVHLSPSAVIVEQPPQRWIGRSSATFCTLRFVLGLLLFTFLQSVILFLWTYIKSNVILFSLFIYLPFQRILTNWKVVLQLDHSQHYPTGTWKIRISLRCVPCKQGRSHWNLIVNIIPKTWCNQLTFKTFSNLIVQILPINMIFFFFCNCMNKFETPCIGCIVYPVFDIFYSVIDTFTFIMKMFQFFQKHLSSCRWLLNINYSNIKYTITVY